MKQSLNGLINDLCTGFSTRTQTKSTFTVSNPATQEVIAQVPNQGTQETNQAISQAQTAYQAWSQATSQERDGIIQSWLGAIKTQQTQIAQLHTFEQGLPTSQAQRSVELSLQSCHESLSQAQIAFGQTSSTTKNSGTSVTFKQPTGLVACMTSSSSTIAQIIERVIPWIATGCTVILTPNQDTPLVALYLARLAQEVGLPQGVLQVLTSYTPEAIAHYLAGHDQLSYFSYTGNLTQGRSLTSQATLTGQGISCDYAGHVPFIVFEDADCEQAADAYINTQFYNAGQQTTAPTCTFVHKKVYDSFVKLVLARVQRLSLGDGSQTSTTLGPVLNQLMVSRTQEYVADALAQGAKLECGGKLTQAGSYYFEPTVLSGVSDTMLISQQASCGPVAAITCFESEAELYQRILDVQARFEGHSVHTSSVAYCYTRDTARQTRLCATMQYGAVCINTTSAQFTSLSQASLSFHAARAFCFSSASATTASCTTYSVTTQKAGATA